MGAGLGELSTTEDALNKLKSENTTQSHTGQGVERNKGDASLIPVGCPEDSNGIRL